MPRYYLISTLIVLTLTIIIAVATQKRTGSEIVVLFVRVTLVIAAFSAAIAGTAQLLKIFGIAEEGFIL